MSPASANKNPPAGDDPASLLLAPFVGLRPAPERAGEIVSPPYDVMSTEEARALAEGRRWSFLRVSRPEIDLPPQAGPLGPEIHARAGENLRAMLAAGVLIRDRGPCYSIYRISDGEHVQTGIAGAAPLEAYQSGRIRRHEFTRPDREEERMRHMDALDAQTGPVLCIHRDDPALAATLESLTAREPCADVSLDGVRHTLWLVGDAADIEPLSARLANIGALYIADGHHRTAAAARLAESRRAASPAHDGSEPYNSFLTVAFPESEVRILDYNRVVGDLGGLTNERFLEAVGARFSMAPSPGRMKPAAAHEFGMYLGGQWYRLDLKGALPPADHPLARLDVHLLAEHLLEPVLGISDPRQDPRIDFVGGARGLEALEARVDAGAAAVAFALYPTRVSELLAVADAGEVMPPKSTWFEPKLADGLISYPLG
ncbi:MAG: DUF1015 domain-containing protein [Alphaproteobacteria bacterium]